MFFNSGDALMRVPVNTTTSFMPGIPEVLFRGNYFWGTADVGRAWDLAPDGRFLMIATDASADQRGTIVVVQSWQEDLKRLVP